MTTLEDNLKFCQIVEPDNDFIMETFYTGTVIKNKTSDEYANYTYIESLAMRWLIDNQRKITCIEGYTVLEDFSNGDDISIDNIIKLAIEMNK